MLRPSWLYKLNRSFVIILEGVAIAIGSLVGLIVIAIPYGAAGLIRWTWVRLVDAWADNK